jgi:hypothetical protein
MPLEPSPNLADTAEAPPFPGVMDAVQRVAAGELGALLLSGSHASGDAVWAVHEGRRVSLSDLDLYLVLTSDAARAAAMVRSDSARPAIAAAARAESLAGPVEISFLTVPGLERLPARPGTLELARHAKRIAGDAAVLRHLPGWSPADVSREERLLLLENRAFELLLAHPLLVSSGRLGEFKARHALHKTALDLAASLALDRGEWPDGARARVEWVRAHEVAPPPAWEEGTAVFGPVIQALWAEAIRWRESGAGDVEPSNEGAWHAVARAWCAVWWKLAGPGAPGLHPYALTRQLARRAPLRRRVRLAVVPEPAGSGGGVASRIRHAASGTPQHRLNAAASALLLAATRPGSAEAGAAIDAEARRTLEALGFPAASWVDAARAITRAWNGWVLGGRKEVAG